jgi:hypothetical protein
LRVDADDARRRIVTPTGRADAMLDELARGLEEWIDSWLESQDKSS